MKPSSVARRKRATDRSFVAIDFETANQSRDSVCSIGIAIAEGGRIVALEQRLIRPPTSEFLFTYIHGFTWNEVRNEPSFAEVWRDLYPVVADAGLERPTTHHSTDRCCVRVAGPIGCDYPNNRLSAPYRWRVPSLASTRQSSRMSADTCESRFPTTKPAPMRRRAHELSWLRWIAAGSLSDDLLRVVRGEGRFSQPAQPGIRRHRQNNVSETGGIPHVHRFDNNDSSQQRQLPRHQTVPGLFRHPRKSVDGIFR